MILIIRGRTARQVNRDTSTLDANLELARQTFDGGNEGTDTGIWTNCNISHLTHSQIIKYVIAIILPKSIT